MKLDRGQATVPVPCPIQTSRSFGLDTMAADAGPLGGSMSVRKMILGSTLGIAAAAALVAAYAVVPRRADLRAFDPAELARLETAMWRDYYDRRYAALFYHLYESTRTQFGFSPFRSLHIALS